MENQRSLERSLITDFVAQAREHLTLADIATLTIALFYTILGFVFFDKAPNVVLNLALNILLCIALTALAVNEDRLTSPPLILLRRFFLLPCIFFMYSQAHVYVILVNPHDVDDMLIRFDHNLFGVNPTEWMQQFIHPLLTEFFQTCYFLYFWIPLVLSVEFYARYKQRGIDEQQRKERMDDFMHYSFLLCFTFYCSYLLYFIAPAVGPCFTLHNFATIRQELPGILLADFYRNVVDAGWGTDTTTPILSVHRNCMPSGHTMVTIVNVIAAFRFRSKFRYIYAVIGTGIIIGIIYLRYHYVVDMLAGIVCAFMALWLAKHLRAWFRAKGFLQA